MDGQMIVARCKNISLQTKNDRWFIVEVRKVMWLPIAKTEYEMNQNSAHLMFNKCVSQIVNGNSKCEIDLDLRDN